MKLEAVVFDVDFTLAKPGPDLWPEGYRRLGERFGLALDPARYDDARRDAIATLKRHPELDHDEEVWVLFTERIIEGMGGAGATYDCAAEMTRAWKQLTSEEILEAPFALIGTVDEMVEALKARRDRWGISFFVTFEQYLEALAPVVARLAGK